jgi:hypothetical protein
MRTDRYRYAKTVAQSAKLRREQVEQRIEAAERDPAAVELMLDPQLRRERADALARFLAHQKRVWQQASQDVRDALQQLNDLRQEAR